MATVKPLDEDAVLRAALDTGAVVTAEEHYVNGGLGSLVSQYLSTHAPVPVESVALRGYAESGTADDLLTKYHLRPGDVEDAVRAAVSRKTA